MEEAARAAGGGNHPSASASVTCRNYDQALGAGRPKEIHPGNHEMIRNPVHETNSMLSPSCDWYGPPINRDSSVVLLIPFMMKVIHVPTS